MFDGPSWKRRIVHEWQPEIKGVGEGKRMEAMAALFDLSAWARGGHSYSSCHHSGCGWETLSAVAGFFLMVMLYQLAKGMMSEGWGPGIIAVSFCAVVLLGMMFIGPIGVIGLLIGGAVLFWKGAEAWGERQKKKERG